MSVIRMSDLELSGKRVLIREDLNVPVDDGKVTSDARIRASLPTIRAAQEAGAAVILMSHLGRPTEGQPDEAFSLQPVAGRLSELLGRDVRLISDWIDGVDVSPGDVVLLENVRFLDGEKACDEGLARKMASLCDVFVMDAFGTAHRAQASTYGVAEHAPVACAGPLLAAELEALGKALDKLEEGAAARRDVGDAARDTVLVDRSKRVAAAGNREGVTGRDGLGQGCGAGAEVFEFEYTDGPVPDHGPGAGNDLAESCSGLGTDIEDQLVAGDRIHRLRRSLDIREFRGDDDVGR